MIWTRILIWLIPRRLISSWPILGVTAFGILAAVTLMSLGAIYSDALAEGGLRHTLASVSSQSALNAHVAVRDRPLGLADYQKLRSTVEDVIDGHLGYIVGGIERHGRTEASLPLFFEPIGNVVPRGAPVGRPFFLTNFMKHTRLLEGSWPSPGSFKAHDKGLDIDVVIGADTASSNELKVGSEMILIPFPDNPFERINLEVVGLSEPVDSSEDYWMGISSSYFDVYSPGFGEPDQFPMYVTEEIFSHGLGSKYSALVGDYEWFLFLNTELLNSGTAKNTQKAIVSLEAGINKQFPRSLVLTGLDSILGDFDRDLAYATVPLFLFISLVIIVILYFLAVVMSMLIRTQSDEASLLKSRGASVVQVGGILSVSEGGLVILAMMLGPFIALLIMKLFLVDTIDPHIRTGDSLSIGLSTDMFLWGAVGGGLTLLVLLASSMGVARLGIVEFLRIRARPPTVPILHRYYIDLFVLVAVGVLWWQIQEREGFVSKDVITRDIEVDPSLLLGPLLMLLVSAFLVLRLLPILTKFMAWVAAIIAPVWVSFALTRIARDPIPYGSLTIILMMATTLGFFGATFQQTLAKREQDRALYSIGADLVVRGDFISTSIGKRLLDLPVINTVTPIKRTSGTLLDWLPGQRAELIGTNPGNLPETAWFRKDFADRSLPELLAPLIQLDENDPGIMIPKNGESIGVWVNTDNLSQVGSVQGQNLWMRVADSGDRYYNLFLGKLSFSKSETGNPGDVSWKFYEAPLPSGPSIIIHPPFSLVSIFVSNTSSFGNDVVSINLDDVTVKGSSIAANGVVIEDYERPGRWVALPNSGPVSSTLERRNKSAREGEFGLTFAWQESLSETSKGIFIPPGPFPLPVIAGDALSVGQTIRVKSDDQIVPLSVVNVTKFFPTIQPTSAPFFLMPVEGYDDYIGRVSGRKPPPTSEFWILLDRNADRSSAIDSIEKELPKYAFIDDGGAKVNLAGRNPMAGGGWNGLTILSIATLTLASLVALSTFAVVSVNTNKIDLTMIKALGFTKLQTICSLAIEKSVIAVLGIGLGSGIGIWIALWVLGFLDLTASGQPIVPPMVITFHVGLISTVLASLVTAVLIGIAVAVLAERRLKTVDLLRIGQ